VSSKFTFADDRPHWERQLGEPAEEYDWWLHWRNEGHRRSHQRVADRFEVTAARVNRVAKQNCWQVRLDSWKAHNSREIRERFDDLLEAGLVPFAQGFARLSAWAVQAPTEKLPADRALVAAATALRVIKEPTVQDMIRLNTAQDANAKRELDVVDLVLRALAEQYPEAHDAVLDAITAAADGELEA
jgi:hypothetical protein